jgi:Uncharacterized protein conserved in bacteria (DUF2188)
MVARVIYHVLPSSAGWAVKKGRAARASSTHPTKPKALRAAAKLARNHPTAQVVEHDAGGVIVADRRYERSDYRKTKAAKRKVAKARKTRLKKRRRASRKRLVRRKAARLGLARRRRRSVARSAAAKKAAARRRR